MVALALVLGALATIPAGPYLRWLQALSGSDIAVAVGRGGTTTFD